MPAILTHYSFIKNNPLENPRYQKIAELAGQGPDVFFFHGYSLHKRNYKKEVRKFGTFLHHTDIAPFYNAMLDYAYSQKKEDQDLLFSFIYGFIMHYILDRNVHPYVFYRTGFPAKKEDENRYMYSHVYFESMMDSEVGKHFSIKPWNNKSMVKCDKEDVKKVSIMLFEANEKSLKFKGVEPLSYYNSYLDMLFLEGLFSSKFGVKRAIYRLFFFKSQLYAQTSIRNVKYLDIIDPLNEKQAEWKDCVSGAIRHESVYELFDKAKAEIPELKKIIAEKRAGKDVSSQVRAFVMDIDHDGFLVGSKKLYMDYVYSYLPKNILPFKNDID